MRRALIAGGLLLVAACRSVTGPALTPLRTTTPADALAALHSRVEDFAGARSMMRVRVSSAEKTQSFRAQLVIRDRDTTDVIVYTPVGTTAGTMHGRGEALTLEGGAAPPAEIQRIFANRKPASVAMLLIGLPALPGAVYETSRSGLQRAAVDDLTVSYEPPHFPPRRVVVRRGTETLEIEHLELAALEP